MIYYLSSRFDKYLLLNNTKKDAQLFRIGSTNIFYINIQILTKKHYFLHNCIGDKKY